MLNLRDISLRTLNPNQFPVKLPSKAPLYSKWSLGAYEFADNLGEIRSSLPRNPFVSASPSHLPFQGAFAPVDFPGIA